MLRNPRCEGLEAGDVRTPAERDASQIALHLDNDSIRRPRTFWGQFTNMELTFATSPIRETSPADNNRIDGRAR